MQNLQFLLILIILASCTHNADDSGINKADVLTDAVWIGDGKEIPVHDSLFYNDDPAPIFRKEFIIEDEIDSAILYITAAGYYKASINGSGIGMNLLDPAWTDYSKRIYYSKYNITSDIRKGANCLGVTLGNGFYNPLPMKMWGNRNLRKELSVGRPIFIAKLLVKLKNGDNIEIITDDTWNFSSGPIIRNDVFLGEVYDARKEIKGWGNPGFNDSIWQSASTYNGPGGVLLESFFPPVRQTDIKTPVEISSPQKGVYIIDMGVNFTGDYNIRLRGEKDDTIIFRFGERIYDNGELNTMTSVCGQIKRKGVGGPGAPDIAWQTDSYIMSDEKEVYYNPEFTFHTYRYMEITGLSYKPEISDIRGIEFHSDVINNNSFTSSSELINSIQEASVRTFLSNLISVQSDCPAREKFGYGGDLNATAESFICNFDMQTFYRKTIYDWIDAINDSVFVDTAPYVGIRYCGISWESAMLITQYYLYLYYNDISIIRDLYDFDIEWMDKVANIHPEGIVNNGLSDHESLQAVPVQLTGTCHYLQCANIMKEFAIVMDDKESEIKYTLLADELRKKIKNMFWDNPYPNEINKQTLFSSLLYHDILAEDEIQAAKDSLLTALNNGPSGHFTTGIFGTKYIMEALSETADINTVFDVVNSREYPGWGYMIDRGATTIWETWKESDNTYSNCHPMFGTVSEWFYRWLGGIRPDPQHPGFERFILAPSVPEGLDYVNCNYHSPFGEIKSEWKRVGKDKVIYHLQIPDESVAIFEFASVEISDIQLEEISTGKNYSPDEESLQNGQIELAAGKYNISIVYKN